MLLRTYLFLCNGIDLKKYNLRLINKIKSYFYENFLNCFKSRCLFNTI